MRLRRKILAGLVLAALLPGCEDPPQPADRKLLELISPAPTTAPSPGPLRTEDLWASRANPWNGFEPGAWVIYELDGGIHERHLLQSTAGGKVELVVQVRPKGLTGDDWGEEHLRVRQPADSWPRMVPLRSSAKLSRSTEEVGGAKLEVQVARAASQEFWLSSQVPGGLVQVSERVGKTQVRVLRRAIAWGR